MNEQIGNKINDKTYIKLTPFKGFVLENFPFIEADFDAITNYQLLCKVIEYLNNVISNQNTVQELGTDLVNAYNSLVDAVNLAINEFETDITGDFNDLKNYVDNYFDNNFPQMISDKLDEMASDGTLENLLNDVAHLTKSYNTYTDMIADSSTFTNGLRLKTIGYYSINDGGGAEYYVSNSVIATNYQIELQNGLYLNLIVDDELLVDKIGAHGDGTTNDTTIIQNAINYCIANRKKLLFNGKTYLIDSVNINDGGLNIYGIKANDKNKGTIIKAIESENPIFNIVKTTGMSVGGSINNITIMANNEREEYSTALNKLAIKILNMAEFNIENVFISGCKLGGLYAEDWWDSTINSLEIRACGDSTGNSALYLGSDNDSCNSLHFFGLHIETCPYQLHIDDLCSHIQFVASKFEVGERFETAYSHMIEIYEGVYNINFDSCFFTNGRQDCDFLLIKNNLTSITNSVFSGSTGQLIKNYSTNSAFGLGLVLSNNTFESLGAIASQIELGTNNLLTGNMFNMANTIDSPIKISGNNCEIVGNMFNIKSTVTTGTIFNVVGTKNKIYNNGFSDNININIVNDIGDVYIQHRSGAFTMKTAAFTIDFNKLVSNVFYNGEAITLTSANFLHPKYDSEISFFTNNGSITFDNSVLVNGTTVLEAGKYATLKFISPIQKWAIEKK